jgi:hypothetical protein
LANHFTKLSTHTCFQRKTRRRKQSSERKRKNHKMEEHQKKTNQIKQQKIEFIQQAIKIKLEPNTTLTEITTKPDDEDSIETITID